MEEGEYNMKKIILTIALLLTLNPVLVRAENLDVDGPSAEVAETKYYQGKVVEIAPVVRDEDPNLPVVAQSFQRVKVKLTDGDEKDETREAIYYPKSGNEEQKLKVGEKVYVIKVSAGGQVDYSVADRYRVDSIVWLGIIFVALVLVLRPRLSNEVSPASLAPLVAQQARTLGITAVDFAGGAPYVEALEQAGLKVHRVSAGAPGHDIGYQRQALKQVL
jgi:hypothetical protein